MSDNTFDKMRKAFYEQNYAKKPSGKFLARVGTAGFGALALVGTHMAYSDEYGAGAAAAYGMASLLPYVGGIAFVGEVGHAALSYGYKQYNERRRLNFGQPMHDQFGTLATMRQRSMSNLSRGRAALGNEGRLHHF